MEDDGSRYERWGWTYERFNPLRKEEIAWYRRLAASHGSPILELACGTGRLGAALATAGYIVDAVDRSPAMLACALLRASVLADDARKRLRLIRADIGNFKINRTYKLIIIADNSLAELPDTVRAGCLRCAQKYLEQNGRLALTVRVYAGDASSCGRVSTHWSVPVTHPITGVSVRRKVELQMSDDGVRLQGTMTYEITGPDRTVEYEICPVEYARYTRNGYISFLEATGWRVESEDPSDLRHEPATGSVMAHFVCSPL